MSEKIQKDLARIGRALDGITAHAKTKVETMASKTISALADHVENVEKKIKQENKDAAKKP